MSQDPKNRGYLYENLILALSRVGKIKELLGRISHVVRRIKNRPGYHKIPEATKDDINEIEILANKKERDL